MAAALSVFGIICVLHVLTVTGDTSTGCDPGWLAYNNNCYSISTKRGVSWASAQGECNNMDSSLLRIYTSDELAWLKTVLPAHPSSGYWTGLNDKPKVAAKRIGTNIWKWGMYEFANMSLVQWMQSPANDGQSNCAGVNIQGKLADVQCMAKQGFICNQNSISGCLMGWLPTDTNCYWVSNTSDPSQLFTWAAAKNWCEKNATGATLLIIDDQNDLNFLTGELPYLTKSTKTHWIGYTYKNNAWGWYNGATVDKSLIQWQTEPDNLGGIENCGVIRMSGMFNTRDCTSRAKYICKKPQYTYSPTDNVGCGPWLRAGRFCYNFHSGTKATWNDARTACLQSGADLIKVDSFDKQAWLSQQLNDPSHYHLYWTGLNDIATESNYVWADNTPINKTFITWNQEPNDFNGNEDCAVIFNSGEYNDVTCSGHAAAICELDNKAPCAAGWQAYGGNCYLFTPSNNASALFSQIEATAYCATFATSSSNIGALLSVNDAKEKAFIKAQLAGMTENLYGWYTSLNDQITEGFWQFSNGLYDSSLVDWRGEPSTKPNDDCGMLIWSGSYHERDCSGKIGYICERLATGVTGGAMKISNVYRSLLSLCSMVAVLLMK